MDYTKFKTALPIRKKSLFLGKNEDGPVYIDPETRRLHMHVIGSTGEGKSKFLEHLIREDVLDGHGLCLIDPHGSLYDNIVRWCETHRLLDGSRPKKIILFDAAEPDWTFGFNPLNLRSKEISYHVDAMVKAVAKVWGGEDTTKTPQLKRCLRGLFHALAEKNLSLAEARYLLDSTDKTVRSYLTGDIQDETIRQLWREFNAMKPRQFFEQFGSSSNRMMEFLANPVIRTIIGQTEETLDFRKIMDEGYVLLVKLAAKDRISKDNATLLGTLIINDLFMAALGRQDGARSFFLYIDECYQFVNEDIGDILDQCRKFGLHAILAHQHLGQLGKPDDAVYKSILQNARTKVIFGGLGYDDAEKLVRNIYVGQFDLEKWKDGLKRPVVTRYDRTWFENFSSSRSSTRGESHTQTKGGGESHGDSESRSHSRSVTPSDDFLEPDKVTTTDGTTSGTSRTSSSSWSKSETSSWSETEGESSGESEGLEPILEWLPIKEYSLEEQIWLAISLMINQPMAHAIIKMPKGEAQFVETPWIEEGWAREERVERFKQKSYQLADFVHPKKEIEIQIRERHQLLELKALEAAAPGPEPSPPDDEEEDFRE